RRHRRSVGHGASGVFPELSVLLPEHPRSEGRIFPVYPRNCWGWCYRCRRYGSYRVASWLARFTLRPDSHGTNLPPDRSLSWLLTDDERNPVATTSRLCVHEAEADRETLPGSDTESPKTRNMTLLGFLTPICSADQDQGGTHAAPKPFATFPFTPSFL